MSQAVALQAKCTPLRCPAPRRKPALAQKATTGGSLAQQRKSFLHLPALWTCTMPAISKGATPYWQASECAQACLHAKLQTASKVYILFLKGIDDESMHVVPALWSSVSRALFRARSENAELHDDSHASSASCRALRLFCGASATMRPSCPCHLPVGGARSPRMWPPVPPSQLLSLKATS